MCEFTVNERDPRIVDCTLTALQDANARRLRKVCLFLISEKLPQADPAIEVAPLDHLHARGDLEEAWEPQVGAQDDLLQGAPGNAQLVRDLRAAHELRAPP